MLGLHVWLACLDRAANNICFTHLCQGSSTEDAAVENMCIKNMHLILESLHLWIALTSAIMINYQLSTIALLLLFT